MTTEQSLDLADELDNAGQLVRAERVLLELVAREPSNAGALHRLASVCGRTRRLDQAMIHLNRALRITPNDPQMWYHLGTACSTLGHLDKALDAYARAVALKPDFHEALNSASMVLLLRGDFARAWPMYESRWNSAFGQALPLLARPRWTGEPIAGKRLLLFAEQGLGDTIQFARYASLMARQGIEVILAVQPPLVRVLRTLHGFVGQIISGDSPLPAFDLYCPLLSVPSLLGTTPQSIPTSVPYLSADPADVARWATLLGPSDGRKRVGLIWAGSPANSNDQYRSMSGAQLAPLCGVPGVRFISLQTGAALNQLPALPADVLDAGSRLTDFADTAGLLTNLDLLISVDTAAVHLAGALNRPVWPMIQYMPDWRWQLGRTDSPWYPSVRLFRQRFHNDWAGTVIAVREALMKSEIT